MSQIGADETMKVCATVNGRKQCFEVEPRRSLADALRYELRLTGTKIGCEHGVCGACTILVDGQPMRSCLMLGVQAQGCVIETVEGLASGEQMHPLQEAFQRHHALQCGFCSSGFLATARALLSRNPEPSRDEVREAISGNICRCTGYETIVDAIVDAGKSMMAMQRSHHEQE